ncbi:hypothetical protein [Paenibacillus phytorum]|uniref:hypothetical protein n=1 Tax=Paenibacillus phytorum TaxID=2654977 RepID=UPI001491E1C0|nr:hypothetical protein [Paenibacillus phytorum]
MIRDLTGKQENQKQKEETAVVHKQLPTVKAGSEVYMFDLLGSGKAYRLMLSKILTEWIKGIRLYRLNSRVKAVEELCFLSITKGYMVTNPGSQTG